MILSKVNKHVYRVLLTTKHNKYNNTKAEYDSSNNYKLLAPVFEAPQKTHKTKAQYDSSNLSKLQALAEKLIKNAKPKQSRFLAICLSFRPFAEKLIKKTQNQSTVCF